MNTTMTKTGLLIGGAALACAALAGCSSAGADATSGATPEPSLGTTQTVTTTAQVQRPVDAYLPSADQLLTIEQIETTKINSCLAAKGSASRLIQPAEYPAFVQGLVRDRSTRTVLYGFFDTDTYALYGYHRPPGVPASLTTVTSNGDPQVTAQCTTDAAKAVDNIDATKSEESLPAGGPPTASTDSRAKTAIQQWSKCMSAAGFNYTDPVAAVSDPQWSTEQASSAEIATATTDVKCKIDNNTVGQLLTVQAAYDQRYIEANSASLTAETNKVEDIIRRAG